jgi:hypothetical protein
MCVCVCVCECAREYVCVCERDARVCVREYVCLCVSVCVNSTSNVQEIMK